MSQEPHLLEVRVVILGEVPWPRQFPTFNRGMTRVVETVLNPVARRVAPWMPGMGVVVTTGRRTGRTYRTPLLVFPQDDGRVVIALTYGPDVDWVKNTVAAGGCSLETRGRMLTVGNPRVYRDPARKEMPLFISAMLVVLGVDEFLSVDHAET